MIRSVFDPKLTLEYIQHAPEDTYFDRKSAQKKPNELADLISAFANTAGGTIAIGINDKTHAIEGINHAGEAKINSFLTAPRDCCSPAPEFETEFLNVTNMNGEQDRILLLHIRMSEGRIVRTTKNETFLRVADSVREQKGDDLRKLEYAKGTRHYEDEIQPDAELSDLDEELLARYKKSIGAEALSDLQVLKSRGLVREKNGNVRLTNAAILLFAKNICQFYPNCRVRFLRYDGTAAHTGTEINIIKDQNIEYPLLRIIEEAKAFISTQLREFTVLNEQTGRFDIVPEYPEFAWQEGLVNAVTHREYGLAGQHIRVTMFDDRLDILSPGKLPAPVTLENMKETRYSRNPRIARVLTELGWVRELNEGVPRIYADMKKFFLEDPVYSEPERNNVRLILKNNIIMRMVRQTDRTASFIGKDIWQQLDDLEITILTYMSAHKQVTRAELAKFTQKAGRTITVRINRLLAFKVIKRNGLPNDPKQTYSLVYSDIT